MASLARLLPLVENSRKDKGDDQECKHSDDAGRGQGAFSIVACLAHGFGIYPSPDTGTKHQTY